MRPLNVCALLLFPLAALADEGMWTLDNFPSGQVEEKYGVVIDDAWLERAQLATTRLENGCTGSFVSPDGLILTNNHCLWGCVRNLSSDERNLSDEGFLAAERSEELQCPGEQVSVLVGYEEVTEAVLGAVEGLSDAEANEARKAALTRLESACEADSDGELHCEAVSLYKGGQYFIYRYRRYDDVRLVFAPELDIAAFGGDPDNFNFPRWSFDMSFLRAYEDGEPASTPDYLSWRRGGPEAGDPVFVTGHPGSTSRQMTLTELRMLRDVVYPIWLLRNSELRGRMLAWQHTGPEAARAVQQNILLVENGIKVVRNRLFALLDDEMMAEKAAGERKLREAVAANPEYEAVWGEAWELIDGAVAARRNMYQEHLFIENRAGLMGDLFGYARSIVRGTLEREKPNEERIRAYTDAALPQLEQGLLADRPISKPYDELRLAFSLAKMREWLGPDSAYVKTILGNESPDTLAARLVADTRLDDPGYRRGLWEGGIEAVRASDDPMIRLALAIEPSARELREAYEERVEAPLVRGREMIADARFEIYGTDIYPDATFTLRVSYGAVEGWEEKGEYVEPFTETRRLFERATGERPFLVPESWQAVREALDPGTPFNFVSTTDTTGGNSGSPVIAADGALVGVAFDGNIHSIAGEYWFDPSLNRSVAVDTAIMLEALDKAYDAEQLLEELTVVE
ncbi:MAG TPA: S46 family peptidase [Woeseiaceae bacterium]|nr:S46 family peptidase [Woeseiaceae bacterium]